MQKPYLTFCRRKKKRKEHMSKKHLLSTKKPKSPAVKFRSQTSFPDLPKLNHPLAMHKARIIDYGKKRIITDHDVVLLYENRLGHSAVATYTTSEKMKPHHEKKKINSTRVDGLKKQFIGSELFTDVGGKPITKKHIKIKDKVSANPNEVVSTLNKSQVNRVRFFDFMKRKDKQK